MKRLLRYSLLLVVPAMMVVTTEWLAAAKGPYWVGMNHDPGLQYLLNSLNLATLHPVGHTVHPGTPIQVSGAVIARVVHLVTAPAGEDLQTHLLKNPQLYLDSVRLTYLFFNSLALIALGAAVLKTVDVIALALLAQLAPFYPHTNSFFVFGTTEVRPEAFLFLSSLLMGVGVMLYAAQDRPLFAKRAAVYFGLTCGFAMATKINFVPLLVLPLFLLQGIKDRVTYVLCIIVGFLFFTLPILAEYPRMAIWFRGLIFHSGIHGQGSGTIIEPSLFVGNIRTLLSVEIVFTVVLAISLVVLAIGYLVPAFRTISVRNMYFRSLLGVAAAQVAGVISVAKHFEGWDTYYLMPVSCLTGLSLMLSVICVSLLVRRDWWLPASSALVLAGLVGVTFDFKRTELNWVYVGNSVARDQRIKIHERVNRDYGDYAKVQYLASSAPESAFYLSNTEAKLYYSAALKKLFPDTYFFNIQTGLFYDWNDGLISFDEIRRSHGDRVVFQGPPFAELQANVSKGGDTAFRRPPVPLVEITPPTDSNSLGMRRETIYEFRPEPRLQVQ